MTSTQTQTKTGTPITFSPRKADSVPLINKTFERAGLYLDTISRRALFDTYSELEPIDMWIDAPKGALLRYEISPKMRGYELNALMIDALPLLERLADGTVPEWDGREFFPRMTEDALDAHGELFNLTNTTLAEFEGREVFSNVDAFAEALDLTGDEDDDTVARMVAENLVGAAIMNDLVTFSPAAALGKAFQWRDAAAKERNDARAEEAADDRTV